MLTSVLPGLREVRAPLSAGFLWLLALWFAFERVVPDRSAASGTLASAYRLGEILAAVGWGAAVTFAAYLVGSLSVFLFSGLLRKVMRTWVEAPHGWRDTLSPGAWQALQEVAHDAAQRLNRLLSLSGIGVDEAIDQFRQGPRDQPRPAPLRAWLATYRRPSELPRRPVWADMELPEERQQRRLAELVLSDLSVIASTRLLGKHPDVFSAVDRDRAEVEFRIAVVPGVLALALAAAVHASLALRVLVATAGGAAAVGLMLDAVGKQRKANELLLDLLQVNAITSPSLERLEAWASDRADRSPSKILSRHVQGVSRALRTLLEYITIGRLSAPAKVLSDGFTSLASAHREFDALQASTRTAIPPELVGLGASLLSRLDRVTRAWGAFNKTAIESGGLDLPAAQDPPLDVDALASEIDQARREFGEFTERIQEVILAATNREAASKSVTDR